MVSAWWLEHQQEKEQPFSRFTDVFDVYAFNYPRCDLLTLLPFFDRCKLAGQESARRRLVTFIFSRLFGSPTEVIKETWAVYSGLLCISVLSQACVLWMQGEKGKTRDSGYLWHFFQSPLSDLFHLRLCDELSSWQRVAWWLEVGSPGQQRVSKPVTVAVQF